MEHELTDEQVKILKVSQSTNDNLLVQARAGAGKTSTIIAALEVIPAASTLICAFNKRIAEEMQSRLPVLPPKRMAIVKTLHSLGLAVLRAHFPHLEVSDNATEELITEAAQYLLGLTGEGTLPMKSRRAAVRLLTTLKETQIEAELNGEAIRKVGADFDLYGDLDDHAISFVVGVVNQAYLNSQKFKQRKTIDFCDMVWGPVVCKLAPRGRYKAVCVDEAQDVSAPQFELIQTLIAPGGRLIMVGDPAQGIYAWRGAVGDLVWKKMGAHYKAIQLPLTVTFRCPKAIVRLANQLVPDLKAMPNAPEGTVSTIEFDKLATKLRRTESSTFVLSRTNQELLRVALELWKAGVRFSLNGGNEIIQPLFWIIEKLDLSTVAKFKESAKRWYDVESKRAEVAQSSAWADRADQQYGMLMVAIDYAEVPTRVARLLKDVLGNERKTSITLSTVHKVKGLEADDVYLIKETFARHRKPKPEWKNWRPPVTQEELNIEYVAITRACRTLTWVTLPENPLTQVLRLRINEALRDSAMNALDQCLQDEAFADEATKLLYGEDATRMLDGRVSIPGEDDSYMIVDPLKG